MTPATMLAFDGIEQPITEWALDYGITPATITARLNRGWSIEQAITTPMRTRPGKKLKGKHLDGYISDKPRKAITPTKFKSEGRKGQLFTHNGETLTASQWAKRIGVNTFTIYYRLKAGYPMDKVLSPIPLPTRKKGRCYTHNGEMLTIKEWAERIGVSAHALNYRLKAGMPYEVAFSSDTPMPKGIALTFNDETHSGAEWCRRTGIPRATLANRLGKLGWTVERALTTPVRRKRRPGVSRDLEGSMGTGGWGTACPIPDITSKDKPA